MAFRIDTNVLYGNACDSSVGLRDGVTEVSFAPDPHGGPECLWFCFRLTRTELEGRACGKLRLILKHAHNILGGHDPLNMRPVVRYEAGDWVRLKAPAVEALPDGRVLVTWVVDPPESFLDVAYCYPYGRPDVDALARETGGYWHADVIGVSQGRRPLVRLSNSYGQPGSSRPGLYLIARQHSGETPGSWVLDGLLRYLASLGGDAPLVWAVPLTNVDGVERGDYGKDNFPYDLNRAWGTPPMRHEVLVFQQDLRRWRERCRPVLTLDFHAPGACETDGIYCYLPDPARFPEFHQQALAWTTAIKSALTGQYAAEVFEQVTDYPSRWETPHFSMYTGTQHRVCGLGVETPYAMAGGLVLTREHYQEAGARIARGIISRLQVH